MGIWRSSRARCPRCCGESARIKSRLTVVEGRQTPRRVALSTIVVMGATLASTLLGFVREIVYARMYGTSWQLDAFLAAAVVPTIVFGVFSGALVTALVPLFSDYVATERENDAWRLASTVLVILLVLLTGAAALGAFFAPLYVPLIARFPHAHLGLAIGMTRILMWTIVPISLSGVIGAMLNAYHRFGAAAAQGIAANVLIILAVTLGTHRYGAYALVYGTLAGATAQLLVTLPNFFAMRKFRLTLDLRHPGLTRLLHILAPIAIGSAAGQVALFFDRYFASALPAGTISGMNYAVKVVGFPQQIFVTAVATVVFPLFASQFALENKAAMRRSISTALRVVVFVTLPSAVGLCMLAGPIVQTLFERGAFTPEATVLCAHFLPFAAVGLVGLAANVVLTRALYASGAVRAAIALSVASVVLNVILSIVWLPSLGARGLLLANAVSQTAQTIALLVLAYRVIGGFDVRGIVFSLLKVGGCALVMSLALAVVQITRRPPDPNGLARLANLGEHLLFGAFVFLGLARMFDSRELHLVVDLLLRRRRDLVPLP